MGWLKQYHENWVALTGEPEIEGETVDLQACAELEDGGVAGGGGDEVFYFLYGVDTAACAEGGAVEGGGG